MMNKNNQNDTKSGLNINFSLLLRIDFFMSVHKLKTSIDFGHNVFHDQFSRQKIINIYTLMIYRETFYSRHTAYSYLQWIGKASGCKKKKTKEKQ